MHTIIAHTPSRVLAARMAPHALEVQPERGHAMPTFTRSAHSTLPHHLADIARVERCAMCDGEGFQLELVWRSGDPEQEPDEHEVRCYGCQGRGEVVRLVCGKCGDEEHASPEELLEDTRICCACGHEAPNLLWLPMHTPYDHEQEKVG